MKDFETITEYEILRMAWIELLNRIIKEEEIKEQYMHDYGRTPNITNKRLKKLNEQSEEIRKRMIEIQ